MINKNLIIPPEDLRLTSFCPNDIDNINEAVEVTFEFTSPNQIPAIYFI
jgi:hypothetical protein